ncbi:response regulator transcription factor [Leuconostoc falkenbergense]|uniref:response regulator n=1 Tax=Leuconostoc falkenbergense TaxID=2766470 RepID=UPI0024AC9BA7|nr:response regulator transcription factor [Leuconostoc falkenbergense]MDI6666739.1 response regulator transcription factor [Leuconostoc falkenbergense]
MKILLVDDHTIVRKGLKQIFEDMSNDYEIIEAENGLKALDTLKVSGKIDVILLDVKMPKMDGLETLKQLTKKFSEIPVIVLTTFDDTRTVKSMINNGAKSYLLKSADFKTITQTINKVLDGDFTLPSSIAKKAFAVSKTSVHFELTEREKK